MATATTERPLTREKAEERRREARRVFDEVKGRPEEARERVQELRAEAEERRREIEAATERGDVDFDYTGARERAEELEAEARRAEASVEDAERTSDAALARLCVARGRVRQAVLRDELMPRAGELGDEIRAAVRGLNDVLATMGELDEEIRTTHAAVARDLVERGGVDSSILSRLHRSAWTAAGFHELSGRELRKAVAVAITAGFLNDNRREQ